MKNALICHIILPFIYNLFFIKAQIFIDQQNGIDNTTCLQNSISCKSLKYVYHEIIKNRTYVNIVIKGDYTLHSTIFMNRTSSTLSKITITGNLTKIIAVSDKVNFVIGDKNKQLVTYDIAFLNIQYQGFGANATAVIVGWSAHIDIINCSFINNACSAINILNSNISVQNTLFKNNSGSSIGKGQVYENYNTFPDGINSAGGAVAILFSQLEIRFTAIFQNNRFIGNRAVYLSSKVVIDSDETSIAFSHIGGAILFAFLNDSSFATVLLQNNTFNDNIASLGGALMFSFHDNTGQNNVTIVNSLLTKNSATISGGGFAFATWQTAGQNKFLVKNTILSYNNAQVGGGGRILLQSVLLVSSLSPAAQIIKFDNVTFFKNGAASASGIHLNYNLATGNKPPVPIIMKDVIFANHTTEIYKYSLQGPSAYTGVLLSNRVDLEFHGVNIFKYNTIESSVHISNTEFYIKGNVTFYKNTVQTSGGAITMTDVSHLYLYPHAKLTFKENYAPVQGGALYVQTVGFPDLVYKYNPSCFIQYFSTKPVPPSEWKVTVQFIQNGAGLKGAAIYTNTITPCIWDEKPPNYSFKKALRWNGFEYNHNYLAGKRNTSSYDFGSLNVDIATDTKSFTLLSQTQMEVSPGEDIVFQMMATDELNSAVYSVPVASLDETSDMSLTQKYFILKPNSGDKLSFQYSLSQEDYNKVSQYDDNIVKRITFVDSSSSFISNATIEIKVKKCPLGFVFKDNTCACDVNPNNHIIRCENNTVYLEEAFWGYSNSKGNFYTRECPPNYCYCNQTDKTKVGCAFNQNSQCVPGRGGTLCGACIQGHGLDLMTMKCIPCEGFHWAILILVIVAIGTIGVVIAILYFNPKFSTLIRGILFFVQMLPYVCDANGHINKIVLTITGWVDVGGINSVPVKSCFLQNFNSLYAVILGYLYPALIFIILLIVYVLHKCYLVTFRRSSPFQAFWILIVLIYKFLVETSLLVLYCVPLNGMGNVFYLDGSVQCFKDAHLVASVIAVSVLLLTVLPPPILVPLIVNGRISVHPGISDALTQGLRKHVRWWWSVDFFRRIAFISIYVFVTNTELKQTLLIICCVFALALHIQNQPYRNELANAGETFLLLCLTLIVTIEPVKYNWQSVTDPRSISMSIVLVGACLYCLFITFYVLLTFLLKKCRTRGYSQIDDLDKESCEEDRYKESMKRRISGNYKHVKSLFKNPIKDMRKAHSDLGRQRPATPAYTRSDLNDFM